MPTDPAVLYDARVMAKGYTVTGDVRSGLKASVPYLVSWANAFAFTNAVILPIYANHIGQVTFFHPYQFLAGATPMYAQRFSIEPVGASGSAIPTRGLKAGEFFTFAKVIVEFESLPYSLQSSDDPQNQNQLDPANPITLCEQSVKMGGKMVTRKGLGYRYVSDGKPVAGDAAVLVVESKLILKFPHVPWLPWQQLEPYMGCVNVNSILGCDKGTLLLEGADTEAKAVLNAAAGSSSIEEQVVLEFAHQTNDWNKLPKPDGTLDFVTQAGDGASIYKYVDFGQIFASLSFVEG